MKTIEQIVTDEQLDTAFAYANFGKNITKRDVLKYTLLKTACGFHNGHTADCIANELGLQTKKLKLTAKGQDYLYEAFRNGTNH